MFECPICLLESSDGVCGFACTHTICKSCDAKMQELVQHRCPICRSCRLGYAEFQCDPDAQFNTQFRVLQGMAAAWRLFDNTTASSQPHSDPSVSAIVFPLQPALEMRSRRRANANTDSRDLYQWMQGSDARSELQTERIRQRMEDFVRLHTEMQREEQAEASEEEPAPASPPVQRRPFRRFLRPISS